ncbi:MAG: alcohol dehydrogenase catalytic domain-containing protein [Candidatus Latescibacterota bacterium]|nr:alcohol dehydrogenase catalytic domain-containing protein [Candidatus Latescibacterota bacterium]
MTALWLEEQRLHLCNDLPAPDPPPAEALIRVRQADICNTDIELFRGLYPHAGVLRHEFVGEVVAGIELLTSGRVDVDSFNEACHPFPDAVAAMEHANRRGAGKILLDVKASR